MNERNAATLNRKLVATLTIAALLALPAVAVASIGTGVGASPIMLAHTARPGHAYKLPGLYVLNTGTVASRYRIRVQRLSPGGARTLPASWVTLAENGFLLRPHHSRTVPFTITIPKGAAPGAYLSDLVASTTTARRPGGAALGAAAAAKFGLSIGPIPGSIPWGEIGLGLLAALVAAAASLGVRRSGLRLRLER